MLQMVAIFVGLVDPALQLFSLTVVVNSESLMHARISITANATAF